MAGSNKENMRQAMKELLGIVGIGSDEKKKVPSETDLTLEQQEVAVAMEKEFAGVETESASRFGFTRRREEPEIDSFADVGSAAPSGAEMPTAQPFVTRTTTTIISAGTCVFGDIRTEGEVEIHGKLKGNLEASGNVRITGKVLGDVKGDSVDLIGCAIQGNITASATLRMDAGTVVVGDVAAAGLLTDGKMKGNVQVEKTAVFQKNAVLAGNVSAALVSMSEGAKIQGTVRIAQDSETGTLFGDGLDI